MRPLLCSGPIQSRRALRFRAIDDRYFMRPCIAAGCGRAPAATETSKPSSRASCRFLGDLIGATRELAERFVNLRQEQRLHRAHSMGAAAMSAGAIADGIALNRVLTMTVHSANSRCTSDAFTSSPA